MDAGYTANSGSVAYDFTAAKVFPSGCTSRICYLGKQAAINDTVSGAAVFGKLHRQRRLGYQPRRDGSGWRQVLRRGGPYMIAVIIRDDTAGNRSAGTVSLGHDYSFQADPAHAGAGRRCTMGMTSTSARPPSAPPGESMA